MAIQAHKKERLLEVASKMFLLKGISETTLAKIAELADVSLNNVYHNFKTKDAIVSDVIKLKQKILQEALAKIEAEQTTPILQLKALIQQFLNVAEEQDFGAMITLLWQELGRGDKQLFNEFLPLPNSIVDWCVKRFDALGKDQQSRELAMGLLAAMQGVCIMMKDPNANQMLPSQARFIEQAIGIAG